MTIPRLKYILAPQWKYLCFELDMMPGWYVTTSPPTFDPLTGHHFTQETTFSHPYPEKLLGRLTGIQPDPSRLFPLKFAEDEVESA